MIRYMLFRSERLFLSQLLERMRKFLKESEKHILYGENTCQLNIQISITFSVIFALKPGFHSGIWLVAGEIFVRETQKNKNNRASNLFI